MQRRSFLHSSALAGLGFMATAAVPVAQAQSATRLVLPATARTATGTLVGTFTPTRAVIGPNGNLQMQGLLTLGTAIIGQLVTLPMAIRQATCVILDLELGPLNLSLLGLNIDLARIDLLITATPGAGLLGDLLCAIAGLLDGNNILTRLVDLINRVLDLFR
ncbi:MAG TPA: hypothetical protein VFZ93_00470 [Albitalea sp.]